MTGQEKTLAAGDPGRAIGLVYLDSELVDGGPKARFANPGCALGSVAVVLSDSPGTAKAIYAGGDVPRADFAATRAAVRAWVMRINTHKDNLAILYVAAHGESFLNRTAFLLEDYDTDPLDVTAGMSEIEQFVSALENATPVDQLLLFDCCRAPTDMRLPWAAQMGTNLIALTRQDTDHGEPRKQWVIAATSLGEFATGLATGPTLFNTALIDALNGVASDATATGWPVRPGLLFDKIDRILALHRLPDERPQTPTGRAAGSFDITFPGEPADVPVYIALQDPADWPDCSIRLTINGTAGEEIVGKSDPPFHVLRVPELADLQVEAERDAVNLGQARVRKVRAPAVFVEIEKFPQTASSVVGQLDAGRSVKPMARIVVAVENPARIDAGAVVEIQRRGDAATAAKSVVVAIGGETPVDVRPGDHVVTLRTPDGRAQIKDVTLQKDQIVKVAFSTQASPHEWLESAAVAGVIREVTATASGLESIGLEAATEGVPNPVLVALSGFVATDLAVETTQHPTLDVVTDIDDGRFLRIGIHESPSGDAIMDSRISFARIAMAGRVELAVLPNLAALGLYGGSWRPYLVVDRQAPMSEPMTSVIVEDKTWEGLLGFLGSRDMAAGTKLLDDHLHRHAVEALGAKTSNPFAAAAGAIMVVAASHPNMEKRWDPWLKNLAEWFPGLPDGPIILGRRMLMRSRIADDIAAARRQFIDGFRRGVPAFSMSVDWMARGFESLPGDDAELKELRIRARQLANRVDPRRPFTVIRMND